MTKTSSAKTTSSTKRAPKAAAALVLNNTESVISADASDMALDDLIASLTEPDEVLVSTTTSEEPVVISDAMLDAAVSGAEATEIMVNSAVVGDADAAGVPTGDTCDVITESVAEGTAPEAKVKKTPTPRKHYTDKTERLKDKLGAGLSEYSVLTLADAGVTDEELVAKMEETMGVIKAMNKKKQTRAVVLIEYLAGKKATLNEVIARAARLLLSQGYLTTGNDGNLFKDLIARPYSPGAARAMGGNTISMMADLKLVTQDGKGKYVANPESLLLMKLQSMLTVPPAEAATA